DLRDLSEVVDDAIRPDEDPDEDTVRGADVEELHGRARVRAAREHHAAVRGTARLHLFPGLYDRAARRRLHEVERRARVRDTVRADVERGWHGDEQAVVVDRRHHRVRVL